MDKAENAMVTITKERYDYFIWEIEQLRGQIVFERLSLRSALDKLRKLDGDIERLRKALEIAADGFRDCGAEDLEDMCRAGIAKAIGGE